jgi:transmembrane protein EpsG
MTVVESIIFYFCVFAVSILGAYGLSLTYSKWKFVGVMATFEKKLIRLIMFILSCLPPILIFSIRYKVGTDYDTYENMYHIYANSKELYSSLINSNKEIGYGLINIIGYRLFKNYRGVLFLVSLCVVLPAFTALYKFDNKHIAFGWFIYLFTLFPSSFNGTRQHIAVSFCMLSAMYAYKDKYLKAILFILIGFTFHKPCLFAFILLLIFITVKKMPKTKLKVYTAIILLITILSGMTLELIARIPLVAYYYYKYIGTRGVATIMLFIVQTFFKLPITCILLMYSNQLIKYNKKNSALIIYTFFDYFFIFASHYIRWAIRMQYYTMLVAPFLFNLIDKLSAAECDREKKCHNWKAIRLLVIITYITRFLIVFGYSRYDGIIPYNFYRY